MLYFFARKGGNRESTAIHVCWKKGSRELKDLLILLSPLVQHLQIVINLPALQRISASGYCFSASLPPYLASASIAAISILQENPKLLSKLQQNVKAFQKGRSLSTKIFQVFEWWIGREIASSAIFHQINLRGCLLLQLYQIYLGLQSIAILCHRSFLCNWNRHVDPLRRIAEFCKRSRSRWSCYFGYACLLVLASCKSLFVCHVCYNDINNILGHNVVLLILHEMCADA